MYVDMIIDRHVCNTHIYTHTYTHTHIHTHTRMMAGVVTVSTDNTPFPYNPEISGLSDFSLSRSTNSNQKTWFNLKLHSETLGVVKYAF